MPEEDDNDSVKESTELPSPPLLVPDDSDSGAVSTTTTTNADATVVESAAVSPVVAAVPPVTIPETTGTQLEEQPLPTKSSGESSNAVAESAFQSSTTTSTMSTATASSSVASTSSVASSTAASSSTSASSSHHHPDLVVDEDDIASKAAVALAAVAAAASANHKSPALAARQARDLAHTLIQSNTGGNGNGSGNSSGNTSNSGTSSATGHGSHGEGKNNNFHRNSNSAMVVAGVMPTCHMSAVKKVLPDRLTRNDFFLQYLLLVEHYRSVDATATNAAAAKATLSVTTAAAATTRITVPPASNNINNAPTIATVVVPMDDRDAAEWDEATTMKYKQASHRVEGLLKRLHGAYESLLDLLPTVLPQAVPTTDLVLDLLPPCRTMQGDVTLNFFHACLGNPPTAPVPDQAVSESSSLEHPSAALPASTSSSVATSTTASTTSAASHSHTSMSPPTSPGRVVGWNVFKRKSALFRKSKSRDSSHTSQQNHNSGNNHQTNQRLSDSPYRDLPPGDYVVKIERDMLGLTVENVLERTVVRTVVHTGPAKKAGAKVGSLICKVGTVETTHLTHFETIDELRQSNRPLFLVLRHVRDEALHAARQEMGRLITGAGFGTVLDDSTPHNTVVVNNVVGDGGGGNGSSSGSDCGGHHGNSSRSNAASTGPLIGADLRIDAYTQLIRRRLAESTPPARNKKEEALHKAGEKLVWILTMLVLGLEREATKVAAIEASNAEAGMSSAIDQHHHQHRTAKDYSDAAKSVAKVLLDFTRKKVDRPPAPPTATKAGKGGKTSTSSASPPPIPAIPGRNARGPRRSLADDAASSSLAHEKPLLQIGDVLSRTRTFLADPASPPAALLRAEVIGVLCDILDIDTDLELSEEDAGGMVAGRSAAAGGINDLGSAGSLLKLIVLNCPIMKSPTCDQASRASRDQSVSDLDDEEEANHEHQLHAGNRFLAVVHRLAASRSTSARITACSLGPVLWSHLDFPHQLQLRGVITRALHDVEVIVRKSTATVLHEIAELVFDSRCVPWLVLMCERAMTDPEPQLRSAAMTLTWHLAEHLPNAFLGDAKQGSRYLRRLPSRDDPLFADVYLLQCKLLPVATRLAEDRSPSVRLAVAAQSDRLCDALGDHWSSVIIDVLLGLLSDSDERVRCEAVSCVPRLAEIVLLSSAPGECAASEVSILEALLPASTKLQKDTCASVRMALATAAGELLTLLVAMQSRAVVSSSHGEAPSPERRAEGQDAGKKYKMHVDDRIIPAIQALLNDADPEVTSASLRAVTNATRSSVQQSRNRHMSVASMDDDASLSSYHSHTSRGEKPVFLPVLSENQVLRLLPTLTELSDSRQWRVRQSAVEIVPALLGCTTQIATRGEISKLCVRLMGDKVDAVRKTAAECLCIGGSSLGSHGEDAGGEWITSIVIPAVRKCASDSLSKQRLLSLKMVEVILLNGVCPNKWYSAPIENRNTDSPTHELVQISLSLTKDDIANVRLNVGRVLETVLHVFEEQEVSKIKKSLIEQIGTEKARKGGGDSDVLYFATRCVNRAASILHERSQDLGREEVHI